MNQQKEVYFAEWCPKCEYGDVDEEHMNPDDPCWDCLHEPMNIDSHKPINFKVDLNKTQKIEVDSYTVSES